MRSQSSGGSCSFGSNCCILFPSPYHLAWFGAHDFLLGHALRLAGCGFPGAPQSLCRPLYCWAPGLSIGLLHFPPALWLRLTPAMGGCQGLPLSPRGLPLRPIQLFQPGLCVRGQAVPEPRQMYAQQAPVSAQCRFCSLSTSCTSHVASVLPTAAAGRGGWHHPHMGHPVGAGGLQAPSPHLCSLY